MCPRLAPRRRIAALAQIDPDILQDIFGLTLATAPAQESQQLSPSLEEIAGQSVLGIHILILTQEQGGGSANHPGNRTNM